MLLPLLSALALGADRVTLVLPSDEPAAAWASPAALGGLTLGSEGPGAEVRLSVEDGRWRVVARDQSGSEKSAFIATPRSASDREDAIWLAESLLASLPHPPDLGRGARRPIAVPPPPAPPAASTGSTHQQIQKSTKADPSPAKPDPPPEAPGAEPAASPPPAPQLQPEAPEPSPTTAAVQAPAPLSAPETPACPPAPLPPAPPEKRAFSLHPWVSAGPALALRPGLGPGAGLTADGGLRLLPGLGLGLGLDWESGRTLAQVPGTALMRALDAEALVVWTPLPSRWTPTLGLAGGLSWRAYAQDGVALSPTRTAVVSVELGASRRLSDLLALNLSARLGLDTATTWLELADGTTLALAPAQGELRLTLRGGSR